MFCRRPLIISPRLVLTLTGNTHEAVDQAAREIKNMVSEMRPGIKVLEIDNCDTLVTTLKPTGNVSCVINKCFGMNPLKLDHLARFIRDPIWHPYMLHVQSDTDTHLGHNVEALGVNFVYPMLAPQSVKRNHIQSLVAEDYL